MAIRVQSDDFDVSHEIEALTAGRTTIGAVATFIGKVRGVSEGQALADMTLEHYPGMTEDELLRIDSEATRRFSLSATLIVHRVGTLKPGENIVLVIACAQHRENAFQGCAFLMDFLKTRATFWKKETHIGSGKDAESHWVDARETDETAAERWGAWDR